MELGISDKKRSVRNARAAFFMLLVISSVVACSADDPAGGHDPVAVAEGEHEHDDAAGAADGETGGLEVDHHGNPVFSDEERVHEQVIQDGVSVEFTIENFLGAGGRGGEVAPEIREGEYAVLEFNITDADTGAALEAAQPAAWLDLQALAEGAQQPCNERIQSYLQGTLNTRPLVDLNSYFILAMNNDNTISVIDPLIDVGGMTNLFTVILLPQPGEDWVMNGDQTSLFVTIPASGQVAVADLASFNVVERINVGNNPVRIALQPDEQYIWVGNDAPQRRESGVAVIDPVTSELVDRIPTGPGHHEIAFSTDSSYALVTNSDDGSLTIIDTVELKRVEDLRVGRQPVAVAVSELNNTIYVASAGDGTIVAIDGESLQEIARMEAKPGLAALRLAPSGRWGFVANNLEGEVHLFDTTTNTITHTVPVHGAPDQITFSQNAAYIRTAGAPAVSVIPFVGLEPESTVELLTIPVGQLPPSESSSLGVADAIFVNPTDNSVLVANPADDQVYYYQEGSQSTSGAFQGHGLLPRAVRVVDRSLKESAPGVYTSRVRVPMSGTYVVAFLLGEPQVVHCFEFTAKPNPDLAVGSGAEPVVVMEFMTEARQVIVGESLSLQFTLLDAATNEPLADVEGVGALVTRTGGTWNERIVATSVGEGVYEVTITPPQPGLYDVFFAVPSMGIRFDQLPKLNVQATADGS